MFEAVIFDWDGTLADTQKAIVTAFQAVFREIDCNVSDGFVRRRIGIGARRTLEDALKAAKNPLRQGENR